MKQDKKKSRRKKKEKKKIGLCVCVCIGIRFLYESFRSAQRKLPIASVEDKRVSYSKDAMYSASQLSWGKFLIISIVHLRTPSNPRPKSTKSDRFLEWAVCGYKRLFKVFVAKIAYLRAGGTCAVRCSSEVTLLHKSRSV